MKDNKEAQRTPITLSKEERDAVVQAVRKLPPFLKNAQLAQLLARSIRDPKLARELRTNTHELFERCGVPVPPGFAVGVHYKTRNQFHVILPSAGGDVGSGPIELTDDDLVGAVATVSFFDDDNWFSDGRDPTTVADKTQDDPGGWSDIAHDDGVPGDLGRDPRANNDA